MDALTREELAASYRTHRLTKPQENHLFAWLEDRRHPDQWAAVLERIMRALEHDPDLTEDHGWTQIEDIGSTLK